MHEMVQAVRQSRNVISEQQLVGQLREQVHRLQVDNDRLVAENAALLLKH